MVYIGSPTRTSRYGERSLADACNRIQQAGTGARSNTLFRESAAIFQLVAGGEIDEAEAFNDMLEAAQAAGLRKQEACATLKSARKRGLQQPRSRPDDIHSARRSNRQAISGELHTHSRSHDRPDYAPREEIERLIQRSVSVQEDDGAMLWLYRHGIDPDKVRRFRLAWCLQPSDDWPPCVPRTRAWGEWRAAPNWGLRLMLPLYDIQGRPRSLVLRRVFDNSREVAPAKSLSLRGYPRKGLVMANTAARALLQEGKWPEAWEGANPEVVIAEGEKDYLIAATEELDDPNRLRLVFGIFSGSWRPVHAAMIPEGVPVIVATDADEAGHKYRRTIIRTLGNRPVGIWSPPRPGMDLSDARGVRMGTVEWNT